MTEVLKKVEVSGKKYLFVEIEKTEVEEYTEALAGYLNDGEKLYILLGRYKWYGCLGYNNTTESTLQDLIGLIDTNYINWSDDPDNPDYVPLVPLLEKIRDKHFSKEPPEEYVGRFTAIMREIGR